MPDILLHSEHTTINAATLDGAAVSFSHDAERSMLVLEQACEPGPHTIHIEFETTMFEELEGIYRTQVDTPTGKQWMLASQFECTYARRSLPCFDEPAMKATFDISTTCPKKDHWVAIGNMPIASEEDLGDVTRVTFETSPKMSSKCNMVND